MPGQRRIQSLDVENDVQVLGGPECESGAGHGDVARSAADEHIAVGKIPEVLTEDFQPLYHWNFSIISSSAVSVRSSRSSFRER